RQFNDDRIAKCCSHGRAAAGSPCFRNTLPFSCSRLALSRRGVAVSHAPTFAQRLIEITIARKASCYPVDLLTLRLPQTHFRRRKYNNLGTKVAKCDGWPVDST